VFYGVQSLLALVPVQAFGKPQPRISLLAVEIEDAPRFASRGMQLDVARNFQTKESILRLLDLLAFYKINRFLLYTTEDEGWRLEIPSLPELTQVGAQRQHTTGKEAPALHPAYGSGPVAYAEGSHGSGYYTRDDFVEILRYAAERHIEVLPVVNFPGHARAAIKAMEARYARLMNEGKPEEAEEYRLIDPEDTSVYLSAQGYKDNVVSVARESSYRFYEKVVEEIARMYEAAGLRLKVLHVGGDEVPGNAWTQSPMAKRLLQEEPSIGTFPNLHAYFLKKLLKRLERFDLEFHGWEEVALLHPEKGRTEINTELAKQPVVAYIWNNLFDYPDLGYRLANAGYKVVLCNVSNFYFDLAYDNDPKEPGLYWAGFVDTFDNYAFAPYQMFNTTLTSHMGKAFDWDTDFPNRAQLTAESRANIIGLEAQLWSETVKGRPMMEYYTLPKLLGFAESAWAAERSWETIAQAAPRMARLEADWNRFANKLALTELPRLALLNGGYNYRIPMPGAKKQEGKLWANTELPGLDIRYTTDGSEPSTRSARYRGPVPVSGTLRLRAFDASGRGSRVVEIN
jgi:hexosaminidase